MSKAGKQFKELLSQHQPLPIVGTINAYCALLAKDAGFKAIYLSGAGVANASYGIPDLGYTYLENVLTDVTRILGVCDLPLLVDADTGYGDVGRAVQAFEEAGVAAIHIEDQQDRKRCGHRPGKFLINTDEMVARLEAAINARSSKDFIIMARCDALANEGMDVVLKRCEAYVKAGADMIFVDAVTSADEYKTLTSTLKVPVLANITEFGKTPIFSQQELKAMGIAMALYPLSAFRAMSLAAEKVYGTIMDKGTQESVIKDMQTREALYEHLNYYAYEAQQNEES